MRIVCQGKGVYRVESRTRKKLWHTVDLKESVEGTCTCEDFNYKKKIVCTHILEVKNRIAMRGLGIEGY